MEDARREACERFLAVVERYKLDPARPASTSGALWSPELEAAPRERIVEIQQAKLAAAYDYLFECSPHYRASFASAGLGPGAVRTLEDLRKVPVTRKLDWIPSMEAHPPWGKISPLLDERWVANGWMVFSTSGTTRQPRMFRHTLHDREMWAWMAARALWSYGVRPGEIALNCFYYGPSVAAWGTHDGLNRLGCSVIAGGAMPSERRALFIKAVRPSVLLGTPSTLLTIARRYAELGDDPRKAGVRFLVCAGEPGAAVPSTKQRLEEAWNAHAHDDFGCTEVAQAPLGYTCQHEVEGGGPVNVHLMEDTHIVEVLHPITLEPVADGERGTLVVSNLYSEAGPYLRYDMGDWVALTRDRCGCGRTHARALGGLLGRNDHCIKIRGLQFFPSTFEDAIRSIPELGDEYRIEIEPEIRSGQSVMPPAPGAIREPGRERRSHRDAVLVIVERAAGADIPPYEVAARLHGLLGITVKVELLEPGKLPRGEGKAARFVDRR